MAKFEAAFQSRLGCPGDHGSIHDRIAVGNAQFEDVGPGVEDRDACLNTGGKIGIPHGKVGHESSVALSFALSDGVLNAQCHDAAPGSRSWK